MANYNAKLRNILFVNSDAKFHYYPFFIVSIKIRVDKIMFGLICHNLCEA